MSLSKTFRNGLVTKKLRLTISQKIHIKLMRILIQSSLTILKFSFLKVMLILRRTKYSGCDQKIISKKSHMTTRSRNVAWKRNFSIEKCDHSASKACSPWVHTHLIMRCKL